jgi:hypothetical protein
MARTIRLKTKMKAKERSKDMQLVGTILAKGEN